MSGTIPLSMTQQFDVLGKPLAGGQLYIIQAGTVSTPQDAFQDTGLAIKHPYPMTLDAAGRIPQFFLADGSVKVRLQDKSGVVQLAADSVLVIGPSAGGGGGSTVDPTQLIQTGMMMFRHGVGAIAGFVRLNNLTIGSATSGATERANADCQALFLFLWSDTTLAVSGGRGANAAADWAANKQLSLPDWRGYGLGALDDMGNSVSGRLTATYFGTAATVLGAVGGGENSSILDANLPPYTPAGTIANGAITITNDAPTRTAFPVGANTGPNQFPQAGTIATITASQAASTFTGTSAPGHTSTPLRTVGPRKLVTFYLKL